MNHQSKIHKIESKDFKKSIHNKLISHKFNDIKEIELSINRNKIKDPFVLYVFGTARLELNELDDAEFLLKKSIEMSNLFFEAIVNLAVVFEKKNKIQDAIRFYKKGLKLRPYHDATLFNIGKIYDRIKKFEKAIMYYRKTLDINPAFSDASYNLSQHLLIKGDFKEGWQRYEDRFNVISKISRVNKPDISLPFWNLDCKDSKLFVWPEQGIGDTIFYSSLLNELNEKCSSITCVLEPRLTELYKRSFPNIKFGAGKETFDEKDFTHQLAIGSIPKFFRNSLEDFSKSPYAYLKADLNRSLKIQDEIKNKNDFTVGISWTSHGNQKDFKSVDINLIINCLKKLPVKIVNLQYGDVNKEISMVKKEHGIDIVQCPSVDIYNDFDGLASLMAACDIVLTTPNVNQTIASALGVPTFLLLSDDPSFRWLNKGMDSIWHPNTKLFRQDKNGDWTQAFNQVSQIIFNLYVQSFQNDMNTIKRNIG